MDEEEDITKVVVRKGQLPLSAQSAFSAIPTSRSEPRQLTYFNNPKKVCWRYLLDINHYAQTKICFKSDTDVFFIHCYCFQSDGSNRLIGFFFFSQIRSSSTYDRLRNFELGFNNKLHRDDREHAKSRGLKVHQQVTYHPFKSVEYWLIIHSYSCTDLVER